MKFFTLILILLISNINIAQKTSIKTITIEPNKSVQNYEHFRRLLLNSSDPNAEYIDGFNFEWGYTYSLKVKEVMDKYPLSDGSQYSYTLIKELTKTKASDTLEFRLYLCSNMYYYHDPEGTNAFTTINDSVYIYLEGPEIEVPGELLNQFKTIVNGNTSNAKVGIFKFGDANRIKLIRIE